MTYWKIRKEELAHKQQEAAGITSGLMGWSCLETGWSYRAHFCGKTGSPVLRSYQDQFKHLYFYFDDPPVWFHEYSFADLVSVLYSDLSQWPGMVTQQS